MTSVLVQISLRKSSTNIPVPQNFRFLVGILHFRKQTSSFSFKYLGCSAVRRPGSNRRGGTFSCVWKLWYEKFAMHLLDIANTLYHRIFMSVQA